jgi:hypothetical protein
MLAERLRPSSPIPHASAIPDLAITHPAPELLGVEPLVW